MALKSVQNRASFEERVEQDGRLTGKHIKTLLHLQDVHSENEALKARVAELELLEVKAANYELMEKELDYLKGELLKCQEIHAFADEAKERLHKMQKEGIERTDSSNRLLTERHKTEMMRLVSEKLEQENNWVTEKQKLEEQIKELGKQNTNLKAKVEGLQNIEEEKKIFVSQLVECNNNFESLTTDNQQLNKTVLVLEKDIRKLTCENDSLRKGIDTLTTKTKVLEVQARQAGEESDKVHYDSPSGLKSEVSELNCTISSHARDISILREEIKTKDKLIDTLEFNLQDSTQTLKLLYKERDLLKHRIAGLLNEIAAMKCQNPEPKQTFLEFVQLKRDFIQLQSEHEKLMKRRGSKGTVLPRLMADTQTIRTTSGAHTKK